MNLYTMARLERGACNGYGFTMEKNDVRIVLQMSSNLRYPTPKMRMGKIAEKIGEVIRKEQELIMNLLHNIYSMYISICIICVLCITIGSKNLLYRSAKPGLKRFQQFDLGNRTSPQHWPILRINLHHLILKSGRKRDLFLDHRRFLLLKTSKSYPLGD